MTTQLLNECGNPARRELRLHAHGDAEQGVHRDVDAFTCAQAEEAQLLRLRQFLHARDGRPERAAANPPRDSDDDSDAEDRAALRAILAEAEYKSKR
jgi:hypothetical protein